MWDKLMANEVFKKLAIDIWLSIALTQETLPWTMPTVINIAGNLARCDNHGPQGVPPAATHVSTAEAVLLIDNCSAHVTPDIFRLLGENHIKIVTSAPHTTNIFQALDFSFFGVFTTKENF
jgi:hypothetical protein